ncbi:MAG TPA: SOS response-associated peptidase [Microbacteriaceae bacterium]
MCGRFVVSKTSSELSDEFSAENNFVGNLPSFNFAPTQSIPLIINQPSRQLIGASWGIIPSWAKTPPSSPLINARIETVSEKPSFKQSLKTRRGVVPASGYFEWMQQAGSKTPFFIHKENLVLFAAIFELPNKLTDKYSVSIITKSSAKEIEHIHDRNPVMIEDIEAWLNSDENPEQLLTQIATQSDQIAASLSYYQVNKAVGSVRNNHPGLISPESDQKLFD